MTSWKIIGGRLPDDLRASMEEQIKNRRRVGDEGRPNPPWHEFPHLRKGSMGWRMGAGEDYILEFREWFRRLNDQMQAEYSQQFPEPEEWAGFYKNLSG